MTASHAILAFVLFAAILHFLSIAIVLARAAMLPIRRPLDRPGVTLLRPARGIENHIEETLASAFRIDYPEFEIIFCVALHDDPIVPVIERLIARHPQVSARLLCGDDRISINPKLNNLVKGWRAARHEWIIMADSNVLIPPDYIDQLLSRWTSDTGLVCSPPVGSRPEGIGAELECAFLNTYQSRWQFVADALGFGFAQGKTMFWRRADLDRAGGIEALATQSAEDAASTKLVRNAGLNVRLVPRAFPQPLGRRSFAEVWGRQIRWSRLRRDTFKVWFVPELFTGGFLPLFGAAVLVATGTLDWPAFLALVLAWYGAEIVFAWLSDWPLSYRTPMTLVLRDLLLPALWVGGWTGSTFVWRGNVMDLKPEQIATAGFRNSPWYPAETIRLFRRYSLEGGAVFARAYRSRSATGRKLP
jgi:ceramide glucosyltransferase